MSTLQEMMQRLSLQRKDPGSVEAADERYDLMFELAELAPRCIAELEQGQEPPAYLAAVLDLLFYWEQCTRSYMGDDPDIGQAVAALRGLRERLPAPGERQETWLACAIDAVPSESRDAERLRALAAALEVDDVAECRRRLDVLCRRVFDPYMAFSGALESVDPVDEELSALYLRIAERLEVLGTEVLPFDVWVDVFFETAKLFSTREHPVLRRLQQGRSR